MLSTKIGIISEKTVILKNHAEANNYQIIHSKTYTHRKPNSNPTNIDIFLSNLPNLHKVVTIDALSSNYLPKSKINPGTAHY